MPLSILIGGDLAPTKSNEDLFINAKAEELIGVDLLRILNASDINIYNLEVPLVDQPSPIKKCGPNLIAKTETINGIKALRPTLLCLANNHILDQGSKGLLSTLNILDNNNIDYIGAGENLKSAQKHFLIEKNGIRIGVYNCAEHEFTIADDEKAGANPFDVIEGYKHVSELSLLCDFLVVIYHGGKEYFRYPSPKNQKYCRHFIDCGADLIICQHSHCVGCEEKYNNGTIVYGQGNFIFDASDNECWQTSILINIDFIEKEDIKISYLPIKKLENHIYYANDDIGADILKGFRKRSEEIKDASFISNKYAELSQDYLASYLISSNYSRMMRLILRIIKKLFGKKALYMFMYPRAMLNLLNIIECEAHNELFIEGLKNEFFNY